MVIVRSVSTPVLAVTDGKANVGSELAFSIKSATVTTYPKMFYAAPSDAVNYLSKRLKTFGDELLD